MITTQSLLYFISSFFLNFYFHFVYLLREFLDLLCVNFVDFIFFLSFSQLFHLVTSFTILLIYFLSAIYLLFWFLCLFLSTCSLTRNFYIFSIVFSFTGFLISNVIHSFCFIVFLPHKFFLCLFNFFTTFLSFLQFIYNFGFLLFFFVPGFFPFSFLPTLWFFYIFYPFSFHNFSESSAFFSHSLFSFSFYLLFSMPFHWRTIVQ
jgi:hypothetical protein